MTEQSQNRKNCLFRILHLLPLMMLEVDGLHDLSLVQEHSKTSHPTVISK